MAGRKLFVGSLPNGIQEGTLRAEFGKYGTVEDVFVKPGCEPGRQWAFVTLSTQQAAQAAKEATDRILQFPGSEKTCDVMVAKNQSGEGGGGGGAQPMPAMAAMPGLGGYQASMASAAANQNRKIFVGSLPNNISDADLRAEFGRFGNIADIHLNSKAVEENRQWAFITFDYPEQAHAAKQAADRVLKFPGSDRVCEVTLARHQGMFGQDALGGADVAGLAVMPGPKKIFCGSLPQSATVEDLKREFGRFGQVIDVHLNSKPCDPGKNWAFITFAAPDQAQAAKDGTDKILTFPGSERACEVMLAKNQGKNGQDPLATQPAATAAVSGYPALTAAAGFPMAAYGYPSVWPTAAPMGGMWRMYKTATGLPYYHNHATGQTQWECPPELQVPGQGAYGAIPVQYPAIGYSPY